jgi:hypothetical protein
MNNKHLNFGVYEATDNFRAIQQHSCVCFDDMGLVAVTGPAEDKESQEYAQLFAAAPDLLTALENIMVSAELKGVKFSAYLVKQARDAISKAKGEVEEAEFPVYYDAQGNEHAEY